MSNDALPIDAHLERIGRELARHGSLVLVAEPGAGKTTRVPPALVDQGLAGANGVVLVLEPRRIAARTAALRISEERGDPLGGFAGYQIRFDARHGPRTRVRVITEGILTRLLQADPSLAGVSAVVLDEFHERSLHADLGLALCAQVQRTLRPDLRLLVMSATLEAESVARYLNDAPIVRVEGRVHPLAIQHVEFDERAPLTARVVSAVQRALRDGDGDVLVFLPGVGEILRAQSALEGLARAQGLELRPLHGEQRVEDQDLALRPSKQRKVILSTNVAETSLTVPGVRAVVDSGQVRRASHDPGRGIDRLEVTAISRSSATQRAGRAGRLGPGRVYRLWSPAEHTRLREHDLPEVRRVDLCAAVLDLHVWGERDLASFPWFEAPDRAAWTAAERLLVRLGALDETSLAATKLGERIAALPTHPRLGRLLHAGAQAGVLGDAAWCAALLVERDIVRPPTSDFGRADAGRLRLPSGSSDLLARLDLALGRDLGSSWIDRRALERVDRVRSELERNAARVFGATAREPADPEQALLRAILAAFPDRVAIAQTPGAREGRMVGGTGVVLDERSVLDDADVFVVLDADLGARGERSRARVRQASAIEREWLSGVHGHALTTAEALYFDEARERVCARRETRYEDLVLESVEVQEFDAASARALLLARAAADPQRALDPSESLRALLTRLQCLAEWMPELALPVVDEATLVRDLEPWCENPRSFEALRSLPLHEVALAGLDVRQRRALEEHAPESWTTPAGQNRRLEYERGKPPVLSVRLQELFGLPSTPTVAAGRVPVLLHLLSPSRQVVQVTQDLASFWNNTYPQVRKDLRGRYPKHSWPEDPWTAPPTSRTKRR